MTAAITDADRALAERFWRLHPRELDPLNITREEFYAREIAAHRIQARKEAIEEAAKVCRDAGVAFEVRREQSVGDADWHYGGMACGARECRRAILVLIAD